jgi:drug/metabolite transporter (DMT)-like permease
MRRLSLLALRMPGQLYLWIAILIFGAANSVTRKLTEIGARHFMDGRNPVSLCNVLFAGNVCALAVMIIIYQRQLKLSTFRQFSQKEWIYLTAVAILSGAIAPSFFFQALSLTSVNNVILVGRLEVPIALALSVWLLRERVNVWEILGALISFLGVLISVLVQPTQQGAIAMGFGVGMGEIFTATAAIALAISTIMGKARLSRIPLGIYNSYRTALGTIVFFVFALLLYGRHHFMDLFSPFLWKWMLVYGSLIVVVGQSFWVSGLRVSTISQASLVSSFTPVVGVVAAYLILGEVPTLAQYIGGSVVLVGILLGQIGIWRKESLRLHSTGNAQQIESGMGFRGI